MSASQEEMGRAHFGTETQPQRMRFELGTAVTLSDAYIKSALLTDDVPTNGVVCGFPVPVRVRVRWADGTESNVLTINLSALGGHGLDHTPYRSPELPPDEALKPPTTAAGWLEKAKKLRHMTRVCLRWSAQYRCMEQIEIERNRILAEIPLADRPR